MKKNGTKRIIIVLLGGLLFAPLFSQSDTIQSKEEVFFNSKKDSLSKEEQFFRKAEENQQVKKETFEKIQKEALKRQKKQEKTLDKTIKYLDETIKQLESTKLVATNRKQAADINKQIKLIKKQKNLIEEQRKNMEFFNFQQPTSTIKEDSLKYVNQYKAEIERIKEANRKIGALKLNYACPISEKLQLADNSEIKDYTFSIEKGEKTNLVLYLYGELTNGTVVLEVFDSDQKKVTNLLVGNPVCRSADSRMKEDNEEFFLKDSNVKGYAIDVDKTSNGAYIKTINEPQQGTWTIRLTSKHAIGEVNLETLVIQSYRANE